MMALIPSSLLGPQVGLGFNDFLFGWFGIVDIELSTGDSTINLSIRLIVMTISPFDNQTFTLEI